MADRYTYIPLIGIFIILVWGGERLVSRRKLGGAALSGFGGLTIVICLALTRLQVSYWHDNLTVFEHALSVTRHNAVAHCHVGIELGERRLFDLALAQFQSAIEEDPNCADGYYGLGFTLENLGRVEEATQQYRNALRASPWHALARNRLAAVSSAPGPDRKPGSVP